MENENLIYGLEFQARSLAPVLADTDKIKFLIGTQSLKQTCNQIHLVAFNEEDSTLKTTVYNHVDGEIWKLNSSPTDENKISVCFNSVTNDNSCLMKTAIYKIPYVEGEDQIENVELVNNFNSEPFGSEVKTNDFHPLDETKCITVTENQVVYWDISEKDAKCISTSVLEGKSNPKFTHGKWNPHQNCNQFSTLTDTHIKTYDIRNGQTAWHIDNGHAQLIRDLDFNLNKQYYLATCGDDAFVKIWDFRSPSQPLFSRSDHSHWIWCVRFNLFHDQLLLTASSDARVLLSSAASVSSENVLNDINVEELESHETKQTLPDGPLQWCEHEDSVYAAEWSPASPWIFASLSYDGRLLISRIKKSLKYQIML